MSVLRVHKDRHDSKSGQIIFQHVSMLAGYNGLLIRTPILEL